MSFFFLFFFIFSLSNLYFSESQQQKQQLNISSFNISNSPWNPSQNHILLSPNSTFAAGFVPLPSSQNLYTFSIWYNKIDSNISTIIWSANDNSPVNRTGSLIIKPNGELSLSNFSGQNLWPSRPFSKNTTSLVLQESGNLVFGTWESFSYPTTTFLPTQNISGTALSTKNGKYKFLNSTFLVYSGFPNNNYWNSDSAFVNLDENGRILKENGASLISSDFGDKKLRRLTLDEDGNLILYSFDPSLSQWRVVWQAVYNWCRILGKCGTNSICTYEKNQDSSITCICPPGFKKVSDSCERKIAITDPNKTKFLALEYVNFSGGSNQTQFTVPNIAGCEVKCRSSKTCLGYFFQYDGNNLCVLQDSLRFGYMSPGVKGVFFLRVDESEAEKSNFNGLTNMMEVSCPVNISLPKPPEESKANTRNIAIISTIFAAELISGVIFFWAFLKKYIKYRDMARTFSLEVMPAGGPKRFSYGELRDATKNFSDVIGNGGFGVVYKGNLSDGRVVAVKSLKDFSTGDADFWAEVTIIARMHHLNLVRLWGYCTEKGKRILVYEYVPNGSLDKFIFPKRRVHNVESLSGPGGDGEKPILDWNIRYRIALGVARAIAYLHEECLEWVLHCDIKPENILLGEDFCPKVSDFGLAKLKKKEEMISMSQLRGTRGYMAPEWIRGPVTSKSDVYSFGMVLLEIVTGTRNNEQQNSKVESDQWYLPMWAFNKVFKEMNVDEILDPVIKDSYDNSAHFDLVNRMVKTAMWCLQDRPELRPSMGKVAKMLEGTVEITEPEKPTIFFL
ncbi:hypothetical protein M9H77_09043 [Catharanthus roseus]|uniref:Uncharacterized protein n=1 Tax=Catharanthus roseus TaxID=4058 RepID=A0ACC0BZU7_CATRO|nr:hypothetical protein M9H77_09043 [Catharanthus roseus]